MKIFTIFLTYIFLTFSFFCASHESNLSYEDKIKIIECKCQIAQDQLDSWMREENPDPLRKHYEFYMRGYVDACLMSLSILRSL